MPPTTIPQSSVKDLDRAPYIKTIHLWLPNIFEFKGGIQVYSNFLLEALATSALDINYEVFLKHDQQLPINSKTVLDMDTRYHFAGGWPLPLRTLAFSGQIMYGGWQRRPSLIFATHLNFTIAAYWLKRWQGIPYWTVAHGIEAWDIQRPILKRALQQADRILAVSHYTRDRLIREQGLPPDRVMVLPNTFDPSQFQIAPKPTYLLHRHGLRREQPILLTVSRLSRNESYKGYNKILAALPLIRDRIPNVHYILIGQGDDLPRLREVITRQGLQDCVTLAGYIPDCELGDYYNLCDAFVMPSKGEGFGIVYLEALACGKPILAGNQDGALDALCHGQLGALVDPDDVEVIARTAIAILERRYPHPLMFRPEALRQEAIVTFGFERFKANLIGQLTSTHSMGEVLDMDA